MNRRNMMLMTGMGALAAAIAAPKALADPDAPWVPDAPPGPPPGPMQGRMPGPMQPPGQPPPPAAAPGAFLFADEFDGPRGSAPDYSKWIVQNWDDPVVPPMVGHYRDDRRNVFLDGNSNLVIRATAEPDGFYSGKILSRGLWEGTIGTTWEARIKLNCLTPGCWPAFWLLNWFPNDLPDGEIDIVEWFGNGEWLPNTTVHAKSDGKTLATTPIAVDPAWHTWRCQWDEGGFRFWKDDVGGAPYFEVPAFSIKEDWPFNDPGYTMFPILNLAVGGPGGGDPAAGVFPAEMLVDYIRVW